MTDCAPPRSLLAALRGRIVPTSLALGLLLAWTPPAFSAVRTIPDRYVVLENAPALNLRVLANDGIPATEINAGALTIIRAPTLGTASIDNAGTASLASDDSIRYQPRADRSGDDSLRYRICGSGTCAEGEVAIVLRPVTEAVALSVTASSGYRDLTAGPLRALPSARFVSSPLVEAQLSEYALSVDPNPWQPFAGDGALSLRVLPSGPVAQEWRILVDARSLSSGNVDLYMGIDSNRDGRASVDELRCASGMSTTTERCEMAVVVPTCGNLAYWVLVVNRGTSSHTARVETFEVPLDLNDGSLAVTGPGVVAAGVNFPLRLVWDSPRLADTESRVGYVRVFADSGSAIGSFPVRVNRAGRVEPGLALSSGVPRGIRVSPGASADRVFIDVPPGATALSVKARSSDGVELYLARVPTPVASAAVPLIAAAPARSGASASSTSASAVQALSVSGAALSPGRWYVVPVNRSPRIADVRIEATLTATAPIVRPGGYFNPARSGHGLFLYPAGNQWAGLWYTYLQDGTPTWYYLQGSAPGSNGQWQGQIYRSAWDGSRNALTAVGEALATPSAADAFTFSYHLDGESGSEAFSSFGRGCPSLSGSPLNVSSHWFDPRRAGTGYSVQMFPNYEFFAAFVYDAAGVPRFLTAERPSFGGASASTPLEQLRGFCPLCARTSSPARTVVGTLSRTFAAGSLSSLAIDANYSSGLSGRWAVSDLVQPLGGSASLQGCSP